MMDVKIEKIIETIKIVELPNKIFDTRYDTYIYGIGSMGRDLYRVLTQRGLLVAGFLDHFIPEQSSVLGVPVLRPEDLSDARTSKEYIRILLAIHNPYADITAICDHLKQLGFLDVLTMVEIYDELGDDLGERYWLAKRNYYANYVPLIIASYNLLADETSQSIFRTILDFRLSGDYSKLNGLDRSDQYCPASIPTWKNPVRLVDCGAYTGDTISIFLEANYTLEATAAFEPEPENFCKLARYVVENQKALPYAILWPCGVYSSLLQLRFDTGQASASAISASGGNMVQCVSLDDALPTFEPTLIKMDIEGAELDALLGASKIIANHRPGLAISMYHRPQDLWQIPLLIERLSRPNTSPKSPDKVDVLAPYQYYLRLHCRNDFELVLYAIPN